MKYTIQNKFLSVTVSDRGAELQSLRRTSDGTEYLWQGDAAYWDERAPVLFPICGRLTEGRYTYGGKSYEMGLHGFVRGTCFSLEEQTDTSLTLVFTQQEAFAASYPFSYTFRVRYELTGSTLRQSFLITNTGDGTLPFSYGAHPGFRVPLHEGEAFSDYHIAFGAGIVPQQVEISPTGFPTGASTPFALTDGVFALSHEAFDGAGIFLTDMGDTVTLTSRKHGGGVRLCYTGMTHLGFWKPDHTDAPFVCIEPWHGLPSRMGVVDDFATKAYMCQLPAGASHEAHIDITVL